MMAADDINIKVPSAPACWPCENEEGVHRPAVKFCKDCSCWVCDQCVKVHKKFSALKLHILQEKPDPKFCSSHAASVVLFFCTQCNECVCPLCRLDDGKHKGHDCVTIDKQVETVRNNLKESNQKRENLKKNVEERKKSLNDKFSNVCKRLNDLEAEVKKKIDVLREDHKKLKDEVEKQYLEAIKEVTRDIDDSKKYMDDPNAAIAVTDLSELTSVVEPQLPEIPVFVEGLHGAGLGILLGRELTTPETTAVLRILNISPTGEQLAAMMKPGVRVKRGRDWKWGDQDNNGCGVISKLQDDKWVGVKWDCGGRGIYRMGDGGAYDLALAV